jgi:transcriptional regulator with XRE-family HTH domain
VNSITPNIRFKEAREQAGLSHNDAAERMGIESIWDIEWFEDELTTVHSPADIQKFCRVLSIKPSTLFGIECGLLPITATELVSMIHEQCRLRSVDLEEFEDIVGWKLAPSLNDPDWLLREMTIDGLQWLCRELGVNWHCVILSLDNAA